MKGFNPKVSIIIPVYNGSNYLKEAIDSALAQTYKNIEVIVVNDGSSDKGATEKIAKSYGKKIKYFRKENGGVATALNLGIEKMTGEYFSWLSHDDMYYPDKIEKQINFLDNLKDKKVVLYSDYEIINEQSQFVLYVKQDHAMLKIKPEYALLRGCVNGITLLIPKVALNYGGIFDSELRCTQDYDMWRRIIRKYKFVHMEGCLSKTRVHPSQDSNNHPRAIVEGDELWINMMEDPSLSVKERLEGSEYNFFINTYLHLKKSPYIEAANYAKNKANDIYEKQSVGLSVSNPLISVIIPCFNQGKYINDAVSSILKQTYKNFEIIIINDGSSDKYTNNLLKKYDKPKTKVYTTTNQGVTLARGYGVSIAKGEYIQFLDADDYISPDKFEQQIRIFKANPTLDVCYTKYQYYFDESGEFVAPELSQTLSNNPFEDFVYRWQRSLSIPIHSALFKSDILKKSSSLVPGVKGAEDWIMWVDLASKRTKFFLLNDDMATYRVQNKSISKNGSHMFYWSCRAVSYIADKYIKENDLDRFNRAQECYIKYLADVLLYRDMRTQIDGLQDINKKLYDENIQIYNSLSWRITKLPRAMERAAIAIGSLGPSLFAKKIIVKSCKRVISYLE